MTLRPLLLAVALGGLTLGACRGGDTPAPATDAAPPTPTPAPAAAPDAASAPAADATAASPAKAEPAASNVIVTVKLLEPGAEPRQALRLVPNAGDAASLDVEIQLDEKMRLGGRDLPSPSPPRVRMTLATKVGAVADGVASYDVSVSAAQAVGLEGAPEPAQRLLPLVLGELKGATVAAKVSATGHAEQAPFPTSDAEAPQVRSLVSSYLQALQNLPVPLPEEPIGVGGTWEVVQRVAAGRLRVEQTLTYEVVSIDGPVVKTKVTATQSMNPDGAAGPGMPPGAKVLSFEGTGSGEKTLDLRQVLPTSALLQLHGVAELQLAKRGGMEPGSLQVTMDILLKAGPGIDAPDLPKPPPPEPKKDEDEHDHDGHGHE